MTGRAIAGSALRDQGPPASPRPRLPAPVEAATAGFFGALSRLRGARIVHPHGVAYAGVLRVGEPNDGYPGVPLLSARGEHAAIVRFSRSVGLPEGLPDLLGVTLRIVDAHGPGRHQDFPLISNAPGVPGRFLLLPAAKGFFRQHFSTVTLYKFGSKTRVVGVRALSHAPPAPARPMRQLEQKAREESLLFELLLAAPRGDWEPVAEIELTARMADEQQEDLRFNPWNSGGGITPTGPLMGLRRSAYVGSQRGRGAI